MLKGAPAGAAGAWVATSGNGSFGPCAAAVEVCGAKTSGCGGIGAGDTGAGASPAFWVACGPAPVRLRICSSSGDVLGAAVGAVVSGIAAAAGAFGSAGSSMMDFNASRTDSLRSAKLWAPALRLSTASGVGLCALRRLSASRSGISGSGGNAASGVAASGVAASGVAASGVAAPVVLRVGRRCRPRAGESAASSRPSASGVWAGLSAVWGRIWAAAGAGDWATGCAGALGVGVFGGVSASFAAVSGTRFISERRAEKRRLNGTGPVFQMRDSLMEACHP